MFRQTATALALAASLALPAFAEPAARVALHVDENDPQKMNLALNNAANISSFYAAKGEEVEIEIVTYGPGLHMLREDTSPVKARISAMGMEMPNLHFAACGNTLAGMTRNEGLEPKLLEEAEVVPSGAVHLIELQQQGWSYLKP